MFKKTVLDSGITIVTEAHRHQRAVSVGAFVNVGTRDESPEHIGSSHFVEHMVFKGTKNRSTSEIARSIEEVGGDLNAFTTREYTCFHATSLKEDLALDIEVLGDLVCNGIFTPKDFNLEKKVILQELAMNDDTPEEYIYDLFFEKVYAGSPLGWPILGTKESLESFTRADLNRFYRERYSGKNLIVAAAGSLDHDEVVENVEKAFSKRKLTAKHLSRKPPRWKPIREVIRKEGEQTHVLVGFQGVSFKSPKRYTAFVLNSWLGGGMSSKLYQSIREKKGLAYTVYSNLTTFTDCGSLTVYAAADSSGVGPILKAIEKDIKELKRKKFNQRSMDLFKQQVRGGILLGADDMENRMNSLGVNEMTFGKYVDVDTVVAGIDRVTAEEVLDLAREMLDPDRMAIVVMGDVDVAKVKALIK